MGKAVATKFSKPQLILFLVVASKAREKVYRQTIVTCKLFFLQIIFLLLFLVCFECHCLRDKISLLYATTGIAFLLCRFFTKKLHISIVNDTIQSLKLRNYHLS